jgi:hypothetical protein
MKITWTRHPVYLFVRKFHADCKPTQKKIRFRFFVRTEREQQQPTTTQKQKKKREIIMCDMMINTIAAISCIFEAIVDRI